MLFEMWKKKDPGSLSHFSTNQLLTELWTRGCLPLYPATEEDELKISLFKSSWQKLSVAALSQALTLAEEGTQVNPNRVKAEGLHKVAAVSHRWEEQVMPG